MHRPQHHPTARPAPGRTAPGRGPDVPAPHRPPEHAAGHPVDTALPHPPPARFPAAVADALRAAGWYPGRREMAQVEYWADTLRAHRSPGGHRHTVHRAAVEAWAEFGGLPLAAPGPGVEIAPTPVLINPLCGLHAARTLADLGRALDAEIAPLGQESDGAALLAMDAEGRVYSLDHTGDWYLGRHLDAALTSLLTGVRPVRLTTAPAPAH